MPLHIFKQEFDVFSHLELAYTSKQVLLKEVSQVQKLPLNCCITRQAHGLINISLKRENKKYLSSLWDSPGGKFHISLPYIDC